MPGGRGKTKVVAGLLALLIGWTGAHHYYLGSMTAGIIILVASVLTCGAAGILPFIEAIMLFIMSDQDFDAKYNNRTPNGMEFVFTKAT